MDLEFDRQSIWHPYTSATHPDPTYPVVRADNVYLYLSDGRRLIDGMSSWWCMLHGYNHPVLNEAITTQMKSMSHVMFGGISHEPAIRLCKHLVSLTPAPLQRVFLCDSGSISVEVALKMAIQYWYAEGKPQKKRFLSFRKGYHGDTFAAMSVSDPSTGMHQLFSNAITQQLFAPAPACGFNESFNPECMLACQKLLEQHHQDLAAVIIEPIVQAAGGMNFYSADFLKGLRQLCDEFNVLLITDEIATNFGRTGKLFGCNHADIAPDIMCLGKALTGGYLTLAATMTTNAIAEIISRDGQSLMHGPTFMANPLACAVADASIELLIQSPWKTRIQAIEMQLQQELEECREYSHVEDVRTLGAIGVIELKQAVVLKTIQEQFVKQGVWIRPFRNLIYVMPPFIIEPDDLSTLTHGMKTAIRGQL